MTTNPSAAPGTGDTSAASATSATASATTGGTSASTASTLVQRLTAEALGTFVLIFFGAGATAFTAASIGSSDFADLGSFSGIGVNALAFALALTAAGYAFSRVSGGHFNPAVSVAGALAGRTAWKDAGAYVGAQVVGALLAGLVLFVLILGFDDSDAQNSLWQTGFGDDFNGYAWWAAFLLEVVLTVMFVYLVLAVTDRRHESRTAAPLAIGLGYGAVVFAGAAATGGSANPARSLGTNVFAGVDPVLSLWLLILAPLVGAAIAGATYPLLFGRDSDAVAGSGLRLGGGAGGGSRRSRKQEQQQYAGWNQGYYGDQQPGQQGWGQQPGGWEQQGGWQQGQQPGQPGQHQGWEQQPGQQGWGQQPGGWQQQGPPQGPPPGPPGQQQGWEQQPGSQDPQQGAPQDQQDWGSSGEGGHTRMRPDQDPNG